MDCGQRNRTAFRIQVEKVHGGNMQRVWSVCFGRETFGSKEQDTARRMIGDTLLVRASSILEDTTDSDGDISERDVTDRAKPLIFCRAATVPPPRKRDQPMVPPGVVHGSPQNSTTIVCVGYVSSPCAAWHGEVYTPASLGALQLDSINQSSSVAIHHRPPNHRLHNYISNTPAELSWSNSTGNCYMEVTASAIAVHLHIVDASAALICHTNISLFLAATCSVIFGGEGVSGTGTV
ncbi:hypothetical protein P4O66_022618 [Electrophorus voltai]|uniref:Uncharacterized protein n=1 Tax=Electrophorus voltai TaxID=2609070 RepID=A0AAD8YNY8_9TELE|nr:hypothetical protein P4O66_022618 [Electrophorus voltai]